RHSERPLVRTCSGTRRVERRDVAEAVSHETMSGKVCIEIISSDFAEAVDGPRGSQRRVGGIEHDDIAELAACKPVDRAVLVLIHSDNFPGFVETKDLSSERPRGAVERHNRS